MPDPVRDNGRPDNSLAASLFRECADELHSFLRRRASTQDVDDLFQTVFERLAKVKKLELVQKPQAYLFGIAFHVVREFWLQGKRDARYMEFSSPTLERAGESLEHSQSNDEEEINLQRQLEQALAKLPENHRRVLLACKRDGMTYAEASAATGISPEMIHKYLVQAKAKIMAMTWDW